MSEHKIPEQDFCGGHCGACDETHGDWERKLAALQERSAELERALRLANIRRENIRFSYEVPQFYRRRGYRTAWESGYESGWRGWNFDNPYDALHQLSAFRDGYCAGDKAARAALDSTQASTPQENAETFPPCKHCGHEGLSHDEEFGNCSECDCPGYEELQPSTPKGAAE